MLLQIKMDCVASPKIIQAWFMGTQKNLFKAARSTPLCLDHLAVLGNYVVPGSKIGNHMQGLSLLILNCYFSGAVGTPW